MNMSFPRTAPRSPNKSYESDSSFYHQQSPSNAPWFACSPHMSQPYRETDDEFSPVESIHQYRMHEESFANSSRRRRQMRLQAQMNSLGKSQQQPTYPTTIELRHSRCHDDRDERLSLDDSFGFDDNTKSDGDALFEKLYHGELDEEDGTLQSSIDLNPYTPKEFGSRGKWKNSSSQITPSPASKDAIAVNENKYLNVISPTVAMDRRQSSKPQANAHHTTAVVSPTSSVFSAPDPVPCTGSALRRTNTNATTPSRPPRSRSKSRSHRSCSRSAPGRRRSRSRSASVARQKDDHNSNIFRGAALIREQLLRSMLSADHAMDEAKREFNEEIIEQGCIRQGIRNKKFEHNGSGDIEVDGEAMSTRNLSTPLWSNCGRIATTQDTSVCAASHDSSAFETESRRLDNLIGILQSTSFASGSIAESAFKSVLSDKENAHPDDDSPVNEKASMHPYVGSRAPSELNSLIEESPEQLATTEEESHISLENDQPKHSTAVVDEALAHAQNAGPLWRSLVGNHVRFPSKWDEILPPSSPTIHSINHKWSRWYYVARHRVKGDKRLNSREFGVRSRRTGGRILLRLVISDMHSQEVCREIAIGCFHPNSKGIRKGDPLPEAEDVREVWMAVRWVMYKDDNVPALYLRDDGGGYGYEGVVDRFLMQKREALDSSEMGSALGHRKAVNNENVRAVLGDQPPLTTVELNEDEFAEILHANGAMKLAVLPALMILKLFLFSKK
ncbi:hypothetical protein ACHAWU_008502 [Discostella pseudostelligera]|uniref:Uncharacterized protein n=1 Tax=Discostella pseudostelligera TaxID=259834 RepID=A0ABD3M5M2_9STRA